MVIDTSAILAIIYGEPEELIFIELINESEECLLSSPSSVEASIVLGTKHGEKGVENLKLLIETLSITIVPFTIEQAQLASEGFLKFGKGRLLPNDFIVNTMYIIHKNDVLITRAGPINRVGIACCVKNLTKNLILSDKTIRIKYVGKFIQPDYIPICINSKEIKKVLQLKMTGMADSQVNINQDNIKATIIPLPPLAEQKAIVEKVDYLMKQIEELEAQIKHRKQLAEELMQTVLREAFV